MATSRRRWLGMHDMHDPGLGIVSWDLSGGRNLGLRARTYVEGEGPKDDGMAGAPPRTTFRPPNHRLARRRYIAC